MRLVTEFKNIDRVVIWFSAGVTSAVSAKIALDRFVASGLETVVVICDTGSEHDDNWRFRDDVEKWLEHEIIVLKHPDYENTIDVYRKTGWLVGPHGARCSLELKKNVRRRFENKRTDLQVFGFDADEGGRKQNFNKNNPLINTWFPLERPYTKRYCRELLLRDGIQEPLTYQLGFQNANCLGTGCVKGQMGYWNHYRNVYPERFEEMSKIERDLGVAINKTYVDGERIPVYLDELPPHWGNHIKEPAIQCGLFCGT